jgi:hypothetical protein
MAESERHAPPDGGFPRPAAPHVDPLEERERSVLAELAREVDAWVSFQGLRRQLRVHQQALTRTLRRLEREGLVAHDGKGYQLTDRGVAALRTPLAGLVPRPDAAPPALTLVEALLPPHAGPGDVAGRLSRRWFAGLRWFAQSEGPGETALHWVTESGAGRVTVRLAAGSLTLEVSPDPADPSGGFAAARPVLAALSEVYGLGPYGGAA